ncbi:hypothetical protein [Aquibacillus rhizosphaerae]|uniref:DUF4025 domain-containing protein n=1 Tax=Aquibacillus rhizosphaerae TaxID=3051431 RepID=A0ABT7L637_9BACI|nr:hypothetical protein [Aquibacillus sp. LR5S19]MDL4841334.1 hypothetical protein [Aquibacillus sp. LR5S19]
MKSKTYLEPSVANEGEQIVSQQILDSYHSGVIDHDEEVLLKRKEH